MDLKLLGILTAVVYFGTAILQGSQLFGKLNLPKPVLLGLACIGLTAHGVLLYHWFETPDGQNLDFFNMWSLCLWLVGLLSLVFIWRTLFSTLLLLIFPLAGVSVILVLQWQSPSIMNTSLHTGVLLHIFISILSLSLLLLAAFQACLLGIQTYYLKRHQLNSVFNRLPPLQTMESVLFIYLSWGFILLSLALISGFLYIDDFFSKLLFSKSLMSVIAWGVLAVLLFGRFAMGWRGTKAVKYTISCVLVLLLAYFGNKAIQLSF